MYSGIYISLIVWLVLSTRKEERYTMEQRREICSGKDPLKGLYVRYSDFHRPNRRGKIWAEIWNEGVHATQIIDTYIPVNFFLFLFWLLVPIGQTEGWKARKRKPERGYTLRLAAMLTPAINSSNRRRENGKKRDASWKNPQRGVVYLFHSISVTNDSDRSNRTEKKRWAVKEKPWRGTHVT